MKKFIYFTSPTCVPCQTYGPTISSLNLPTEKVDVSINMDTATKYGVRAVPTTILLKDGVEVWRNVGATTKQILQQAYDRN